MSRHTHTIAAPDCPATSSNSEQCTCDAYYGFNGDGDFKRAVEVARKLDGKRQQAYLGNGPDSDGGADDVPSSNGSDRKHTEPDGHFWKRSEFLACNAGEPMQDIDMTRFQSENWQRAKESQA